MKAKMPRFWNDEKKAFTKREHHLPNPVNIAAREFHITLGTLGVPEKGLYGVQLSRIGQVREDAATLALSLSLRCQYHPNSTYVFRLDDQDAIVREHVLRALARTGQLQVRLGRRSGEFHVRQTPGWNALAASQAGGDVEIVENSPDDLESVGIYSRGEVVEAEELDDLTRHLRGAVDNLMKYLAPHRVPTEDQLELFK
jgi:hypothetical protein